MYFIIQNSRSLKEAFDYFFQTCLRLRQLGFALVLIAPLLTFWIHSMTSQSCRPHWRATGRGGEIAIFIRNTFTITRETNVAFNSFEHIDLFVKYKTFGARFVIVYRPPPSKKNNLTSAMFCDCFSWFYEQITLDGRPSICGDFNYHVDDTNNTEFRHFTDFLDSMNLVQHVSGPTHRRGHTLDLIISRKDESLIEEVQVLNDIYSDHRVVTCKLDFTRPPRY